MSRTVYFDCPSGASGDMILGALVDAGVSVDNGYGAAHQASQINRLACKL
jgi:uncharacterized protein (DUF111 family)